MHLVKTTKITITILKMAKTYHGDTVVEERLSKDEKVEIRVHSDLRKDRQHRHRINCHHDDCCDGADDTSPAEMREEKRNISMTERGVTRTLVSFG